MNCKILFSSAAVASILIASSAFAGSLDISRPWARASAGGSGAAYLTLHNSNDHDHTLVSVASNVAKRVELHNHTMIDGMLKMRQVKGGLKIPAGDTVMLKPGGYHIMMMGLHAPLKEGTTFPLTLSFDSGEDVTVTVNVNAPGAMGPVSGHDGGAVHKTDMGHTH